MPEVVRYLIVKKRVKTEQDIADEKATEERLAKRKEKEIEKLKAEKESPAKASEDKDKKPSGKEKMSLEDLDKKLDEILDTDEIM